MGAGGFPISLQGVGFAHWVLCINPAAFNMQSIGDYGWGGARHGWVDPQEDIMCVFMTQFMPGGRYPVQEYLRHLVLGYCRLKKRFRFDWPHSGKASCRYQRTYIAPLQPQVFVRSSTRALG